MTEAGYRFSRRGCPDCGGAVVVKHRGYDKKRTVYACEGCGKTYCPGDTVKFGIFMRKETASTAVGAHLKKEKEA